MIRNLTDEEYLEYTMSDSPVKSKCNAFIDVNSTYRLRMACIEEEDGILLAGKSLHILVGVKCYDKDPERERWYHIHHSGVKIVMDRVYEMMNRGEKVIKAYDHNGRFVGFR